MQQSNQSLKSAKTSTSKSNGVDGEITICNTCCRYAREHKAEEAEDLKPEMKTKFWDYQKLSDYKGEGAKNNV